MHPTPEEQDEQAAMRQLAARGAIKALIAALAPGQPHGRRVAAARELSQCGGKAAIGPLLLMLREADPTLRLAAASALWWVGDEQTVEPLIAALADDSDDVAAVAAETLERIGDRRAVTPLIATLTRAGRRRQRAAAGALGWLGDRRAITPLITGLVAANPTLREAAARSLQRLDPAWRTAPEAATAQSLFVVALQHRDPLVRREAAQHLAWAGDRRCIIPLMATLRDDDDRATKDAALATLLEIGGPETISGLAASFLDAILDSAQYCRERLYRPDGSDPTNYEKRELELCSAFWRAEVLLAHFEQLLAARAELVAAELLAAVAPLGLLASYDDDGGDPFGSVRHRTIDCTPLAALAAAELDRRRAI